MVKVDSATLLALNALVRSNRLKFLGVLAADLVGLRYSVVRLDPAVACNLRCAMCYYSDPDWFAGNAGPRFTPDRIRAVADAFFPEALQLHIGCGSEPTMWKDYPSIVEMAKARGVPFVSLVTNAQLLRRPELERLVAYGLDEITVSVHGTDAATYERLMTGARWQRLHDNLALLETVRREAGAAKGDAVGPALRLNFTANNDNVGQIPEILTAFAAYRPRTIQIRPIITDLGNTAYTDTDLARSLPAYEAGVAELRRQCAEQGVRLLANTADPLARGANRRAVVYEHAVLRYISPQRVWKEGYDPTTLPYPAFKRRTGFRRSLLGWALRGTAELEKSSHLSASEVF